jgi:hypothetical protein
LRVSTQSGFWVFESSIEHTTLVKDLSPPVESSLPALFNHLKSTVMEKKKKCSPFNYAGHYLLLTFFCITIFISCNSDEKKQDEKNMKEMSTTDNTNTSGSQDSITADWQGGFPYLGLPKKTLDSLFITIKCKKVVFAFQFDNTNSSPSLVAFGAKDKKYLADIPQYKLSKSALSRNLSGEFYLSDLELTDKQYEKLMKDRAYSTSEYLVFEPGFSISPYPKSITYNAGWGSFGFAPPSVKILGDTEELKPSPPAPPGDN